MFFKVLGEVVYKRCFAVCHIGIMLNVLCTNIAVRIGLNLMFAKNPFIEVHYNFWWCIKKYAKKKQVEF